MSAELSALCAERRAELTEELVDALQASTAASYRALVRSELHGRAARLVEAFVDSLENRPASFVRHVESIVSERIAAGFGLDEVQAALSLFEEQLWRLVAAECPVGEQPKSLARVSAIVGAGKDRLAQLYLAELRHQRARLEQCERRLDALFRGTEDAPPTDDV